MTISPFQMLRKFRGPILESIVVIALLAFAVYSVEKEDRNTINEITFRQAGGEISKFSEKNNHQITSMVSIRPVSESRVFTVQQNTVRCGEVGAVSLLAGVTYVSFNTSSNCRVPNRILPHSNEYSGDVEVPSGTTVEFNTVSTSLATAPAQINGSVSWLAGSAIVVVFVTPIPYSGYLAPLLNHSGSCKPPNTTAVKVTMTPSSAFGMNAALVVKESYDSLRNITYCTYSASFANVTNVSSGGATVGTFQSQTTYLIYLNKDCNIYTVTQALSDLDAAGFNTTYIVNLAKACGSTILSFQCASLLSATDADQYCQKIVEAANTPGSTLYNLFQTITVTDRQIKPSSNLGMLGLIALVALPILLVICAIAYFKSGKRTPPNDAAYRETMEYDKEFVPTVQMGSVAPTVTPVAYQP